MPDYSIKVDVPFVNVDVLVTTKDGQFIPGLKKDNFRVLEDGVQQSLTNFNCLGSANYGCPAGRVCLHELLLHGGGPERQLRLRQCAQEE